MTMSLFFFILAMLCLLGVVGSLFYGLFAMTRGRREDNQTSNGMMRARIWLQGLTLLFLFLSTLSK